MIRVLFVCTGNICRSPTAEGIFKKIINEHGLAEKIYIDSAGTHNYHLGEAPDKRSQLVAKKHGVDLSLLKARQITTEDFEKFDYIIAMDHYNVECLHSVCPEHYQQRISLLLTYADNDLLSDEVPDPYYGEGDGFQYVYELILESLLGLLASIKKQDKL